MSWQVVLGQHPRRGGAGPDAIPVPAEMLQARLEQVRVAAERAGLSALVIFSQGARQMSGTGSHGYLRYLLDWFAGGSAMLVVPVDGAPIIVVPGPSDGGTRGKRCRGIRCRRCGGIRG